MEQSSTRKGEVTQLIKKLPALCVHKWPPLALILLQMTRVPSLNTSYCNTYINVILQSILRSRISGFFTPRFRTTISCEFFNSPCVIYLLLLLLLKWLYSPMRTLASLMDLSQSSRQSIWLFRSHILGFVTVGFFRSGVFTPRPTPNLEDQVSIFISSRDWVAQLCPQAPSTQCPTLFLIYLPNFNFWRAIITKPLNM
jgi:hypothetical protein